MAEKETRADEKPVAVAKATTPAEREAQRLHDERAKAADEQEALRDELVARAERARFTSVKQGE